MMNELIDRFAAEGRVEWIGLSAASRAAIQPVTEATVRIGTGLDGDHHASGGKPSSRQVTLIQQEHLPVIAALCGRDDVTPDLLRRNIVVSGINLLALKTRRFRIGEAILEGTGPCVGCSRMEENLGPGGYNAVNGHSGINTRVLQPGVIRVGDAVQPLDGDDRLDAGSNTIGAARNEPAAD